MRSIVSSAGIGTPTLPLEILFVNICEHGIEDFACRDASCRPPTSGGTGGSRAKGAATGGTTGLPSAPGMGEKDLKDLFPNIRDGIKGKTQYSDGTMSVEGLAEDGSFIKYDKETEANIAGAWKELGITHGKATANLVHSAEIAMGLNTTTGKFDKDQVAKANEISVWYSTQGKRLKDLAEEKGVNHDTVVAAATVLSAGRLWDGVANGNYETAARLIRIMKADKPMVIEQQHLDYMAWRANAKGLGKSTGQSGFDYNHKLGKVKPSKLNSAQLVETMYALQSMRGHKTFAEWAEASSLGKKTPKAHIKIGSGEYPLFTSKGVAQVKQAVGVLRGEVTPRQAIAGPKYSSFFSNLRNPNKDYSSTNDTWHYRAMAGKEVLNPMRKRDQMGPGTIRELTIKEHAKYGIVTTSQDLFQVGPASIKHGLKSGDAMFRDSTQITRTALDELKRRHPTQFGKMKIHELQALVWVHYGGGQRSDNTRQSNWDRALDTITR